jgi:hypothetical protein
MAGAIAFEPFINYRWMGDIPAQAFELPALIGGTTHRRMQTEAVRVGAKCWHGLRALAGDGLQAPHLLRRPRPKRNAIGA